MDGVMIELGEGRGMYVVHYKNFHVKLELIVARLFSCSTVRLGANLLLCNDSCLF